jgi:aspartyl-tRNA(Asn)/glutamyl-tRNA(Gln) amidotransferase subunit C
MSTIDRDQVRKVALLARLQLSAAEEESFTTQLSDILNYFEQLNELDTTDVAPTTRAIDVSNVTRPDTPHVHPNRQLILDCAPDLDSDADGEFFRVPKILNR